MTAIDLSEGMLERARTRVEQYNLRNVRLIQMDATELKFPDNSFDIVYAPYFISCVPDPLAVTREMRRVCRPGGRLVFLNHFLSDNHVTSKLERAIAPLTLHLGFKSDFDLPAFLAQTGLRAASIEKVNVPRIWSLVICRNAMSMNRLIRLPDLPHPVSSQLQDDRLGHSERPRARQRAVPLCRGRAARRRRFSRPGPAPAR